MRKVSWRSATTVPTSVSYAIVGVGAGSVLVSTSISSTGQLAGPQRRPCQ